MAISRYAKPIALRSDAQYMIDRLEKAFVDLTGIAAILRDGAQAVWTTGQDNAFSLKGWRNNFKGEFQKLKAFNTANRAQIDTEMPAHVGVAIDAYLDAVPRIGVAFTAALTTNSVGGELIVRALPISDRALLATAIEAELA